MSTPTSTSNPHTSTPPLVSLISGGIAGGVEGFLTYPFEYAKTILQLRSSGSPKKFKFSSSLPKTSTKPSRNPYAIVLKIYRTKGLPALYKGCSALVFGSIAKDAVRFLSFDTLKNAFRDKETGKLTPGNNMLAGMAAGVVASVTAVTPTERLKTALIDDSREGGKKKYTGNIHCIKLIVQEDGLRGLYRGLVGTTLKQASATSFRMGSYNIIKDFEERRGVVQNTGVNFLNGAGAGVVTTLASQPFDTVKTRSQAAVVTTTVQAVRSVWREDGVRGFWRGTVMRLSRTVFSGGILFTTAEAVAKIISPLIGRPGG